MNPFEVPYALPADAPPAPVVVPITLFPKIKAWSYSVVNNHSKCALQIKFNKIDRLPQPDNEAQARGNAIHSDLAHLIRTGEWPVGSTIPHRDVWFKRLRYLYDAGAQAELQHAFDRNWNTVSWFAPDVYGRVVIDAIMVVGDVVSVHEHKSGKVYPEHEKQKRLYGLMGLVMHPEASMCLVHINYIDQPDEAGEVTRFNRDQVEDLKKEFDEFAAPLLNDDIFPAGPGRHCNWCHYRKSNGGPCVHG